MGEAPGAAAAGAVLWPWEKGQRLGLSYSPWDRHVHLEASLPCQDSLGMRPCLGCAEPLEVTLPR